ncbi:MAG: type II secretion system F family protein [Anaerolineae bacterium]|jgi:tight adherence protein B|nr:type II secretion system F family protein [Anaerolineae bacterium]
MPVAVPVVVAVLVAFAVVLAFMGLWLLLQRRDPVDERLTEYGLQARQLAQPAIGDATRRYGPSRLTRILTGFGAGQRLALALTRADLPLTAAEFSLIVFALFVAGLVIGTWRLNIALGAVFGAVLAVIPYIYMGMKQRQRLRAFTEQLPDMLTLLVGGLRAGYGLNQALDLVVQRLSPPMSSEIGNVTRAVNLGLPLNRALEDAVVRVGSEDFNLIVVAMNVQRETGGNLAETLDIIGDTVRDRLRMLNEIRVLTAQQRFTGYLLAFLPLVVGLVVFLINPEYVSDLFAPGWVRILPITAVLLQIVGFLIIRKIVDIEV